MPQIFACLDSISDGVLQVETESDWLAAAEVLRELRPTLEPEKFLSRKAELTEMGFRLVALRKAGEILSVASFTVSPHALHGAELLIHDMATVERERGKGHAQKILDFLELIARGRDCFRIFVHSKSAAGFYENAGYELYSQALIKRL